MLVVLNTHGNGFFANLLGINNSRALPEILQPEFLEKVKELLPFEEYVQRVNVLPVYNSIFGGIEIKSDLKVNTDILIFQGAINLQGPPFPVNESTEIKIYGNIHLILKNATLSISPSESYMLIKPENQTIEGEVIADNPENTSRI